MSFFCFFPVFFFAFPPSSTAAAFSNASRDHADRLEEKRKKAIGRKYIPARFRLRAYFASISRRCGRSRFSPPYRYKRNSVVLQFFRHIVQINFKHIFPVF